jgi:hypothetical protein
VDDLDKIGYRISTKVSSNAKQTVLSVAAWDENSMLQSKKFAVDVGPSFNHRTVTAGD